MAVVRGEHTLAELPQHFGVHPTHVKQWHDLLHEGPENVFGRETKSSTLVPNADAKTPRVKIGELTLENGFLGDVLTKEGLLSAKMIDREHKLSHPLGQALEISQAGVAIMNICISV